MRKIAAKDCRDVVLRIAGAENGETGYGVGCVQRGESGRQVSGGPLIVGPWAYTYGLCSVIDTHGGTWRINAEKANAGLLIDVEAGDQLEIDGVAYKLSLCPRRYPQLTSISSAKS